VSALWFLAFPVLVVAVCMAASRGKRRSTSVLHKPEGGSDV
jgi:bacteriorhodopsin